MDVYNTELDDLRNVVIAEFSQHWNLNDGAHRIGHFAEVEDCGNVINTRLSLGFEPKLIMLVAYFHDLFAWSRINHEKFSFEYVEETDHPIFKSLTTYDRAIVAYACLEHRASYKGEFTNLFSEMMSSADRGSPGHTESMIQRSIVYHRDALKVTDPVEARERAIIHIKEKFGTGGYARYPNLYLRAFGPELEFQRSRIDAL